MAFFERSYRRVKDRGSSFIFNTSKPTFTTNSSYVIRLEVKKEVVRSDLRGCGPKWGHKVPKFPRVPNGVPGVPGKRGPPGLKGLQV